MGPQLSLLLLSALCLDFFFFLTVMLVWRGEGRIAIRHYFHFIHLLMLYTS